MSDSVAETIAANVAQVNRRIAEAAADARRDPAEITLVGVTKTFPVDRVRAAHAAGLRHFGENRVQEAQAKIPAVAIGEATWHLIGHLQSNKVRPALTLFQIVESVDSLRLAERLSAEAERQSRDVDVLLEVNVSGEATKFGFTAAECLAQAPTLAGLPRLRIGGLMTVAPLVDDAAAIRSVFGAARDLGLRVRDLVGAPDRWDLSMGMSQDFPLAIAEGATIVRVGRAIFGERS